MSTADALEDERAAHEVACQMRNDAETMVAQLLAALKSCWCPAGGWTGQPEGMEPTIENCMKHSGCGCDLGEVVRKATEPRP